MNNSLSPIFIGFPKTHRFDRSIVVTEKIDGTTAQIFIQDFVDDPDCFIDEFVIYPVSRKRWLTLENANFDFCRWVYDNAKELVKLGQDNICFKKTFEDAHKGN